MPRQAAIDEYAFGLSWTLDEPMARTSHALVADGAVWLVDPVAVDDVIERVTGLGEIAGTIQLLDRHNRDCASLAERFGVEHHRLPSEIPGTPFEFFKVVDKPRWRETAIWWPDQKALVVTETLMTVPEMAIDGTGVGLHPMLRLLPPGSANQHRDAEHLLPGHGPPLHADNCGKCIDAAIDRSRRDLPRLLGNVPRILKSFR